MKRTLSLVLALVMVLGSFGTVFAVDTADKVEVGEFLEAAGVLKGDEKGDLMLGNTLLRQDMVILLSRLMGVEEVAKGFESEGLTFEDIKDSFYDGYVAWAVNNQFIKGHSDELFGYGENVTAQQYVTVLMRALGYEVEGKAYDTILADAKELGLCGDLEVENTDEITRGQMSVMTFNALATPMKDSEVTLAESLEIEMPAPEVPAVLEVEEVYADNLKQVNVVFNQKVDEKTATDKNNYSLKKSLDMESVELMEDGMTVVITLDKAELVVFKMQDEYTLTVNNVKSLDGTLKLSNEKIKFKPVDVTVPTVKEVIGLGTKAIKVVFSEPIKSSPANSTSSYRIDDKYVAGTAKYVFSNEVILSTNMTVGEHTLSVKDIKDFNNYAVDEKGFTFYVEEDTEAPEIVKAYSKDLNKAVIEFNEPVKSVSKAYHTSKGNSATVKIEGNKVTLEFTNKMSLGSTTLYLEGVQDYSDNKADRNVTIDPELDMTRPEVVEVKVKDGKGFTITFNKDLESKDSYKETLDKDNYTVKNSDGTVVKKHGLDSKGHPIVTPRMDGKRKVKFDLFEELPEGSYIIEVSGVRDSAEIANVMIPFSDAFDVGDVSTLGINKVWVKNNTYTEDVYVQFNKDIAVEGNGNALVVDKYSYGLLGDSGYEAMPKDTKIELVANDVIRLVLDKDLAVADKITLTTSSYIRAVSIGDKEDKIVPLLSKIVTSNKATIKSAKALKVNEIEVIFNGEVSIVEADFTVSATSGVAGNPVTLKNYTKNNDNNTVATFSLAKAHEIDEAVALKYLVVEAGNESRDNFGNELDVTSELITDKISPTVAQVTYNRANQIDIAFKEPVKLVNSYGILNDAVKVTVNGVEYKLASSAAAAADANGDNGVVVATVNAVVDSNNKTLVLEFAVGSFTVGKTVTITYSDDGTKAIRDNSDNGAEGFGESIVITPGFTPIPTP